MTRNFIFVTRLRCVYYRVRAANDFGTSDPSMPGSYYGHAGNVYVFSLTFTQTFSGVEPLRCPACSKTKRVANYLSWLIFMTIE